MLHDRYWQLGLSRRGIQARVKDIIFHLLEELCVVLNALI